MIAGSVSTEINSNTEVDLSDEDVDVDDTINVSADTASSIQTCFRELTMNQSGDATSIIRISTEAEGIGISRFFIVNFLY